MGEWNAETRRDETTTGIDKKGPVLAVLILSCLEDVVTLPRTTRRPVCLCCAVLCFALGLWALASRHLVSPLRYPVVPRSWPRFLASWLLGFFHQPAWCAHRFAVCFPWANVVCFLHFPVGSLQLPSLIKLVLVLVLSARWLDLSFCMVSPFCFDAAQQ